MGAPRALGRYRLCERLGRGGMAEVWRAEIAGPGGFTRSVVVKRVLPELSDEPSFAKMFAAEARILSRLAHVNIVQVFEFGEVDGQYFLALEHVRGRDLGATMEALSGSALAPGLAALVARDVARALGHVHGLTDESGAPMRLIHRDVSPGNVMIGLDGAVKLLDFGIAKPLAQSTRTETAPGTLKGKIAYMAPEQIDGLPLDGRADLYSLGVLLHELLTGRPLFGEWLGALPQREARSEVGPPSQDNPSVPPALDRICMKALAPSRDDRHESAVELAAELDAVVRELGASREALVAEMRALFPDDTADAIAPLPGQSTRHLGERGESPRRRRALFAAGGLALLAAGGGGFFLLRHHPSSPAPVAPKAAATPKAIAAPAPVAANPPPRALPAPAPPPARIAPASATRPHGKASAHGKAAHRGPDRAAVKAAPKENLPKGDIVNPFHH